jgi:DNA-binding LacI/PurR family transcriptional regulator
MSDTNRPVTIKQIAESLGVSFSTVSKALNDDPLVNEETRDLVKSKANEMNYIPNQMARSLRSRATKTIAMILNDMESPPQMNLVNRISLDLAKNGFTSLLYNSHYDAEEERNNIHAALSRSPDGVILAPVGDTASNIETLRPIQNRLVILGDPTPGLECNYIQVNSMMAGYVSATTALRKGHVKFLLLTGPVSFPPSIQYLAGIRKAFAEIGQSFDKRMILHCIPTMESAYQLFSQFLRANRNDRTMEFSVILSLCDVMAIGVYKAAADAGLRIPEAFSIIGYDDISMSSFLSPPLTTIHLPLEQISEYCSNILSGILLHGSKEKKVYSFEPYLVERRSLVPIP